MGTLVATYSESERRFFPIAGKFELKPAGVRRVLASPLRYCLGANYLYLPAMEESLVPHAKLCWARIRGGAGISFTEPVFDGAAQASAIFDFEDMEHEQIRVGDRYLKRQKEREGRFVAVDTFCSQALIDSLAENPEALPTVSHDDFEALCAEVFARRGFQVDLFRASSDGGIDFLAVEDGSEDPIIFAVQCKQPEERTGKARRALGRPTVQQIYGAAKAWDLAGAIAISGSTYSPHARAFADLKPAEIKVYNSTDLLAWISKYRWNMDE